MSFDRQKRMVKPLLLLMLLLQLSRYRNVLVRTHSFDVVTLVNAFFDALQLYAVGVYGTKCRLSSVRRRP